MSIDYRTYVGPYVRCAVGRVDTIERIRACTKADCPNHRHHFNTSAFCDLCGSPIGDVTHTAKRDAVDAWAMQDVLGGRLVDVSGDAYMSWSRENGAHVWVPNVSTGGRDYQLEEHEDFNLMEITAEQVLEERSAFTTFFQDELTALRSAYGPDAVSVRWGIIQDYI